MGAGLGGGSADAACTLVLLNRMFSLGLSQEQLASYASQLGSDCAFFIYNTPMLGTGRGEILKPVNVYLKGYSLVLVKPEIHVGTAEAYRNVKLSKPELPLTDIVSRPVNEWKTLLKNNFEENIFTNHPEIASIKERLYEEGAAYACMSGSGSTVFGIFDKPKGLERQFPGCFYWEGVIDTQ
jgi:4-diphosphocytidyl-2-C-methyl-D-erythritol kinase